VLQSFVQQVANYLPQKIQKTFPHQFTTVKRETLSKKHAKQEAKHCLQKAVLN
jgi:hypothetical protein